jgi:uncharacterized membrane protein YbhN (UPF0104 family)
MGRPRPAVTAPAAPGPLGRNAMRLARAALTLAVVAYVYRKVDWSTLSGSLRLVRPPRLLAAAALQGLAAAAASTRWRLLLREQGIRVSWPAALRLTLVGLFFNFFLLGSIGGDAARFVGALRHDGASKAKLARSLVQDRLIGLFALLLILAGALAVYRPVVAADRVLGSVALIVYAANAAFLLAAGALWLLGPARGQSPAGGPGLKWKFGLDSARASFPRGTFLGAMALSLANHALSITAAFEAAHGAGIPISLPAAALVIETTALALSLPITIAGLGVRDGMLLWLLGLFGLGAGGAAVRLSACLLGVGLLWALIGGLVSHMPTGAGEAERG